MRRLTLGLILLVTFLLGSTLVVPAEELDFVRSIEHAKYHNAGVDLFRAGQYKKALKFLDKAIEIYPSHSPLSYEFRAKVYFKLKQYNKAWDDVKMAQSLAWKVKTPHGKGWKVDPEFLKERRKASGRNE